MSLPCSTVLDVHLLDIGAFICNEAVLVMWSPIQALINQLCTVNIIIDSTHSCRVIKILNVGRLE